MESTGPSEISRRVQPFADALAVDAHLDELALTLAAVFRPDLDLIGELAQLDQLAADCPTPTREGVIDHLFGSGLFAGDRADYHSWRNSCLDHVVSARRGMPITLAVVAIEVARRIGVRLCGVGLPGHFIVGDPDDGEWFADPFHGTSGLARGDCRELIEHLGISRWSERFLDPTPDRMIVARILNNLKMSCERRRDPIRMALVMRARAAMEEFAAERDLAVQALAPLN